MQTTCSPRVFSKRMLARILITLFLIFSFLPCSILSAGQKNQLHHDLFSVNFPTENDGFTCGRWGTILHTTDGGKTWMHQESGTDFTLSSICFADPKKGWAVGDGGTIIHTEDGGETWEKQQSPLITIECGRHWGGKRETGEKEKSPLNYFLMGVHFTNDQKGWIVTERTTILYTEDGGKTWQIQFSDEDFILKSVSFCDELNGWAAGEFGYIYHTDNGGQTWQHQAGYFDISDETGEMIGGNFLFDVIVINPQTAWVAGIDGYIAKTVDAGATWQKMTNGVPKRHLFGIASDRQGTIFIGGNALLLTSSDGGETFRDIRAEPPITYGWVYRIALRGTAGLAAVGKDGWIYLTDREAKNWRGVKY